MSAISSRRDSSRKKYEVSKIKCKFAFSPSPEDGINDSSGYVMIFLYPVSCKNTKFHFFKEHVIKINVTRSSLNLAGALLKLNLAVALIPN
jgi:hypothetical protein